MSLPLTRVTLHEIRATEIRCASCKKSFALHLWTFTRVVRYFASKSFDHPGYWKTMRASRGHVSCPGCGAIHCMDHHPDKEKVIRFEAENFSTPEVFDRSDVYRTYSQKCFCDQPLA